ncbi:MAG: two-component regulator propeller domain-containing protein [Chitinophagaceae bacterium]
MRTLALILACFVMVAASHGQPPSINFHHLTANNGLADGTVRALGQDKYGYTWVGTLSGLSRYNGYTVKTYQNTPGDSLSAPASAVRCILGDSAGNLWVGFSTGFRQFDFTSEKFYKLPGSGQYNVTRIIEVKRDYLYMATSVGLACFNPSSKKIFFYRNSTDPFTKQLLGRTINDVFQYRHCLYITSDTGLVILNTITQKARYIVLPPLQDQKNIEDIAVDGKGRVWAVFGENNKFLLQTDTSFSGFRVWDKFYYSVNRVEDNSVRGFCVDSKQRLWLITSLQGLARYDEEQHQFVFYNNDPEQPYSISYNHLSQIYQDKDGFIWLGTEGNGVDYFHPDNNFFTIITGSSLMAMPPSNWGRAALEDKEGNLWLGWGGFLSRLSANGQDVRTWKNIKNQPSQIQYNSIRAFVNDANDNVWIATAGGVNRYNTATGNMEFLDEKDSLPKTFYWALLKDYRDNIWIGERANLYYYSPTDKKVHTLADHPVLHQYKNHGVRCIFEDSHHRLWFGMNGSGLVMYDPQKQAPKAWQRTDQNDTTLLGNYISAITEDKKGIIWIASFFGLVSYDPETGKFKQYTRKEGLPSLKTSCLMVDDKDRLWVGSSAGLLVLEANRQHVKVFDVQDGLPGMEFNDQGAYRMKDGRFLFPSIKGFVIFDPLQYKENVHPATTYLASLKVSNQSYRALINAEEVSQLDFNYQQNFFSFELAAINYSNPGQTWYAYKLEPFDKDWITTRDRFINYTNVPGGDYVFRFKSTTDPNDWNVPEKAITMHIDTVFYKTWWFRGLVFLLIALILYQLYRYRINHEKKIHSLKNKAQLLEKEKALVMYESLKQQLNPHFLFNSLTSLSSLIQSDQKMAKQFLDHMSKIYRYILKSRDSELVSLPEEIKLVQTYTQLQQTRFQQGLQLTIEIPDTYYHYKIVPVTLQNLTENAIKHNIIDEESPLHIHISVENDYLLVRNNIQKKSFVETSNRQGLHNMQSLYRYLCNKPLMIEEDEQFFTVKIPLI